LGERAIAEIEKLGGKVERDSTRHDRPVVGISLDRVEAADVCLKQLKGLTTLQKLQVSQNGATDASLQNLIGLTGLRQLFLYDIPITDAGLGSLKGLTNSAS
jgi:hypothetical protein